MDGDAGSLKAGETDQYYSSQSEKLRTFAGETKRSDATTPVPAAAAGSSRNVVVPQEARYGVFRPPPRLRLEPEAAR